MKNGSETASKGRKRFYKEASTGAAPGGWAILLDGRGVKTPLRAALVLPARGLAEAIAEEWRRQGETVDPASMPLTKLANTAIDAVAPNADAVAEDIVSYGGRDLLCYRASHPASLVERQRLAWDPLLDWARDHCGASLVLAEGVMPIDQPPQSLAALRNTCLCLDAFGLVALHLMTTLTGSAILALAHTAGGLSLEEAWDAAHLDEDHQADQWGEDEEAKLRREARFAEMRAASEFYRLSRKG
jgi:chaperone required for assembly of F1-ATPase